MATTSTQKQTYVGLGASAGGLDAINAFFKEMPLDSGLTFIVIQHLSPDYKSMMVELLSKVTDIPVEVVKDGVEPQPNHIYLIPPSNNMTMFHGKLLLQSQDRTTNLVNLPIDVFFSSMAEDQHRNAIGIILSGTGSDGTRGCRAIKEVGGLVMVQSEGSAKFSGMPVSIINNNLADYILPADELPAQLLKFVKNPVATKADQLEEVAGDKGPLAKVFALLRSKTKIDFTFYKAATISRRIERRISITLMRSIEEYVEYLNANPQEVMALYRELLIGVTNFYRDEAVFDSLLEEHLYSYIQATEQTELRIWVAGCSTGEEAYTYCMLIKDISEQLGKTLDVKLFATDIDQDALNKASQGVYPESIAADLPSRLLNKYLIHKDDRYQVVRAIREMVVFARHDLIKDPPFTNVDLVSCRNMLIYVQPVLQRRIFDSFNFSLRPGGLLVLGTSESLGEAEVFFDTLDAKKKIYQSRGSRKSLLAADRFQVPDTLTPTTAGWGHRTRPLPTPESSEDARILEAFIDVMTGEFLPSCMIVNESFELIRVMGDSKRYLRSLSGKVTTDITKNLVTELSVPVATGLTKVFKTRTMVSFSNVYVKHDGQSSKVNILVKPMAVRRSSPLLAAVVISEVSAPPAQVNSDGENYDVDAQTMERLTDLEQELQFTRESLQATIEEMETSNEELQASNEELLASNEELQSTNEELQSVNEELFTVNAEYQSKILELSELNADLENFMAASRLHAVFLDANLTVRRFTPSAKKLFNIVDHDVGRPLSHISHRLRIGNLTELSTDVATDGTAIEIEVCAESGVWYRLSILPFMLARDVQGGVMLVLHDINELLAAKAEIQQLHQRKRLAQALTGVASWEMDLSNGSIEWSEHAHELLGVSIDTLGSRMESFIHCVNPKDRKMVQEFLHDTRPEAGAYETKEFEAIWPDGSHHLLKLRCAVSMEAGEKASRLIGILHEVRA